VVSDTQITAVVPANAGSSVNVTTSFGTGSLNGFTFVPAPIITSFTPTASGQYGRVVLTGANFLNASAVKFGGTPAAYFVVVSATQINAWVGLGSLGQVSVETLGGIATLNGFTFLGSPSGRFLKDSDYALYIKDNILLDLLRGNPALRIQAENAAYEEIASKLRDRILIDEQFAAASPYDPSRAYNPLDQVEYQDAIYQALNPPPGVGIPPGPGNIRPIGYDVLVDGTASPSWLWQAIRGPRNPQLVECMIDIVIYLLEAAIKNENVSAVRVKRYDAAMAWLKDIAVGGRVPTGFRLMPDDPSDNIYGTFLRYGNAINPITTRF
jgi:hypothetical protein